MRFERHLTINIETFNSFYNFIEEQKKKYKDEQLIGYEAHRNDLDGTVEVILIFSKDEKSK
jgi:hypothetical protein